MIEALALAEAGIVTEMTTVLQDMAAIDPDHATAAGIEVGADAVMMMTISSRRAVVATAGVVAATATATVATIIVAEAAVAAQADADLVILLSPDLAR